MAHSQSHWRENQGSPADVKLKGSVRIIVPEERMRWPTTVCHNVPGSRKSELLPEIISTDQIPRKRPVSARQYFLATG